MDIVIVEKQHTSIQLITGTRQEAEEEVDHLCIGQEGLIETTGIVDVIIIVVEAPVALDQDKDAIPLTEVTEEVGLERTNDMHKEGIVQEAKIVMR